MAGGGSLTLETDGKVVIGGADALANRPTHTPTGAAQPGPAARSVAAARGLRNTTSTAVTACAWPRRDAGRGDAGVPIRAGQRGHGPAAGAGAAAGAGVPGEPAQGRADAARRRDLTLRSQRIEMARTSISALARWCRSILAARSACWAAASPWMARCAPGGRIELDIVAPASDVRDNPRPGRTTAPSGSAARRRWTSPAAPPVAWTLTVAATARRRQAAASCWAARWTGTRRASPIAPVISPSWCAGRRAGRLGLAPGHRHARQPPGDAGPGRRRRPDRAEVQLWPVPGWRYARAGGRRARPAARWRWRWKRPRSRCRSTPRTACAGRAN